MAPVVGTRLYFIPIRYWEREHPIETGYLTERDNYDGTYSVIYTDKDVYAFHDGYGHNVYMRGYETFLSLEDAEKRRKEMILERGRERAKETKKFMELFKGK